jgi:Cof subfamily protein (haloacid dehalogenase superfamily)
MEIQLVAIDLDGTLFNTQGQPSPLGSRRLKQAHESGIRIIISSTRDLEDVQKVCASIGIEDPVICSNGGYIYASPWGAIWRELLIPLPVAQKIGLIADEAGWELSTSIGKISYWKQRLGQKLGANGDGHWIVATNREAMTSPPHIILTWQPEAILALAESCREAFPHECRTEIYYTPSRELHSLGIFAAGADKGSALELVIDRLGVLPQAVMAIGDNNNDLPMFRVARHRVAMANGTDELKNAANIIAPGNDDEGVAWVFEKYILPAGR